MCGQPSALCFGWLFILIVYVHCLWQIKPFEYLPHLRSAAAASLILGEAAVAEHNCRKIICKRVLEEDWR